MLVFTFSIKKKLSKGKYFQFYLFQTFVGQTRSEFLFVLVIEELINRGGPNLTKVSPVCGTNVLSPCSDDSITETIIDAAAMKLHRLRDWKFDPFGRYHINMPSDHSDRYRVVALDRMQLRVVIVGLTFSVLLLRPLLLVPCQSRL